MTAPARPAAAAASEVDSAAGRKAAGETPKAAGKSASLWADSRDAGLAPLGAADKLGSRAPLLRGKASNGSDEEAAPMRKIAD